MKTTVIGSDKATTKKEVKNNNRPSLTGKEAKKDEAVKDKAPAQAPQVEAAEADKAKAGSGVAVDNQPANAANAPQAEEVKRDEPKQEQPQPQEQQEVKSEEAPKGEVRYIKPPRNVESTIKEVETLYRKSIQRNNLIARKKQLEQFEVALSQDADELSDNPFQGCKLIIEDDKKRQFITTTPGLIRLTAQFIYNACDQKQAELEAVIIFPNA